MLSPTSLLLVLLLFLTGIFTRKSYYNSLIKQCLQAEHKHYKKFAAFWDSDVNTSLKTSNFGIVDISDLTGLQLRNTLEVLLSDVS